MKNKLLRFLSDKNGSEFIDIAVIVAGSILVLYAIYELIKTIDQLPENTQIGIIKKQ